MTHFTHQVTRKQFLAAADKWHEIMNRDTGKKEYSYFDTFIGTNSYYQVYFKDPDQSVIKCTERAYNKIEMLSSPHARTLLKAFKAKYGYHKDIP